MLILRLLIHKKLNQIKPKSVLHKKRSLDQGQENKLISYPDGISTVTDIAGKFHLKQLSGTIVTFCKSSICPNEIEVFTRMINTIKRFFLFMFRFFVRFR